MDGIGLDDFLNGDFVSGDMNIIGIAGGSGSGKSYIAERIADKFGARVLAVDDYMISKEITKGGNWDLPKCWNLNLLGENLRDFRFGRDFKKPIYDFNTGKISGDETFEFGGKIVVEGLYALCDSIIKYFDFSVFVDSPEDVRLGRRVKRDFVERSNKSRDEIVRQWGETVQPTFLEYVEPQKERADLVLSN